MFDTPILYIIFNRLDTVKQTFPCIKKQQPRQLFIAADGSRDIREGEAEKCAAVREWVMGQIDWQCDVHTLFRDENLGCKYGVAGAIKWFFSHVDKGIVLEDDILPADTFFKYCETLLDLYKDNDEIGFISGAGMKCKYSTRKDSYFLSTVPGVWGWASWKRAINGYDPDYASLIDKNYGTIKTVVRSKDAERTLLENSLKAVHGKIDTWDYQMVDFMITNERYTIFPVRQLVRNVGFSGDGTHTTGMPPWYEDVSYDIEVITVTNPKIDKKFTSFYEGSFYGKIPFHKNILRIIKKIILFPFKFPYRKFMRLKNNCDEIYRSWIRWLDGALGQKLRYKHYKKRLKYLGSGTIIDTGVFIDGAEFISIGENTHIDKNCILVASSADLDLSYRYLKKRTNPDFIGERGSITIGKECHISQNAMIYGYGGVQIGDFCVMSADSKIYSLTSMAYNPCDKSEIVSIVPYSGKSPTLEGAVVMGDNAWIGIGVVVSPGVTLGKNSFVKSYSLVNGSFGENTYAGGIHAVEIRKRFDVYNYLHGQ